MTKNPRIPTATYRLQFNRQFTFADARAITPYLHALGISDAYASPYFQARAESLHGYDITDHNKLNPAIGSREEYDAWVAELHARQMGQLLDFVPNHMGVGEPLNTWWQDVLENGPSSAYAKFFDIDWRPLKSDLHDKVLLPILGDQYGRVLERGELKVHYEAGAFYLCYYEHELPIAPGTYRFILDRALQILEPNKAQDYYAELQSIRTALEYLPKRTETDPNRIAERAREKEIIKRRLDRRCDEAREVLQAIEQAVAQINGKPGDARSFDLLDELVTAQAYRLAFWRVAAEEINYRRFFDVNDLAAIRMELPEVFDATHKLLLELVGAGAVTGIRIDHPDGLYLPNEYFRKLQQRCAEALRIRLPADGRAIYVVVEKILTGRERLPRQWPVHGTTGYDFASLAIQLLVDSSAEQAMTKIYRRFIGHSMHFGHLAYAKKRLITRLSLANDVAVLGSMLDRLSETTRWFRDFTLQQLQIAVRETIACFPVYRTYVAPGEPVSEEDRGVIERAVTTAKRRNPGIEESVFNYLRDILLLKFPQNFDEEARAAHTHFVLKFQQATGPITAKGIEDTAFYVYNRLVALNEVGGEPQQFGCSVADFHHDNSERLKNWPATLVATSTHDTKRSEDVRARIVGISELSDTWRTAVIRWRTLNRRAKTMIDDSEAPDPNEEYLFYQTLLGTWPVDLAGKPEQLPTQEYIQRIQSYMAKALKEAKINTSWIQPNESWDNAVSEFVVKTLEPSPRNRFLPSFFPLAEQIAQLGAINSLSQLVLKITVPGVPDIYQGNEMWDLSLVDPDNRRAVDYSHRQQMLESLASAAPDELVKQWPDGRIKLLATARLLNFRREHANVFTQGNYLPLQATGTFAESCVAFAREHEGNALLVIVPRLSARVGFPPIADKWHDTAIELPDSIRAARELFTGRELIHQNGRLAVAEALRVLPFAAYVAGA